MSSEPPDPPEAPRPPSNPDLGETARQMRAAEPYISAVWKLVGGAVVGVLGGYFGDRALGTTPWLLVSLSTLGIGVGFYAFIRTMLKLDAK